MPSEHPSDREGRSGGRLILASGVGAVAWGLNLQINYSLVQWACASDHVWLLTVVSLTALSVVVAGIFIGWHTTRRLRGDAALACGRAIDRDYFLALAAFGLNGIFALLIVTSVSLHGIVPCG